MNLALLASAEATLQVDVSQRAARGNRHRSEFNSLTNRATAGNRRPKVEEILDTWSRVVGRRKLYGLVAQAFKHRHWLAHGRHWSCKCGYHARTPGETYDLLRQLKEALPLP
ncbi:MAG TPA: hypothetical protein VK348_11710 [Planctomycetota bacterium]|nr:hypothetical protein [Planctomycetota bacterium]